MQIINLGLLAHVDAGKTTLTEQLLYLGGAIKQPGRVDEGTAHTDFLGIERRRGISVRSALASCRYKGVKINLIDTPGHTDFAAEVERALVVLDVAIVLVSAVEGVQAHTRALFQAVERLGLPALFFINKVDRAGADIDRVLEDIRAQLTPRAHFLGDEEGISLALCEQDDQLLESYLNETLTPAKLEAALIKAFQASRIRPVLTGAALPGEGVALLLDALVRLAPRAPGSPDAPLSGVVFRVEHDAAHGRIAHVRLYGGTLRNRDAVLNRTQGLTEKVFQIRSVQGQKSADTGVLAAGDIGAVYGLAAARVGDILGDGAGVPRGYGLATPLLRVKITPSSPEGFPALRQALFQLAAEDPHLDISLGHQMAQAALMGKIQLEVLDSLLKERFGIEARFADPVVLYKETPARTCEGFEAYTMPKPCWAVIRFLVEPLPPGSGVEYVCAVSNEKIHYRYQGQIEQTLPEALRQGPLGFEVTDLRVTLIDGEDHPIHTHPLDFALATPLAMMDALVKGGTILLEPMLRLNITAPKHCAGRIVSDMVRMRGELENPQILGEHYHLTARVPVSTSLEYPTQLAALTSGQGVLTAEFDGYQPCPPGLNVTQPHIGVDPRDRAKYILWKRSALSDQS